MPVERGDGKALHYYSVGESSNGRLKAAYDDDDVNK